MPNYMTLPQGKVLEPHKPLPWIFNPSASSYGFDAISTIQVHFLPRLNFAEIILILESRKSKPMFCG